MRRPPWAVALTFVFVPYIAFGTTRCVWYFFYCTLTSARSISTRFCPARCQSLISRVSDRKGVSSPSWALVSSLRLVAFSLTVDFATVFYHLFHQLHLLHVISSQHARQPPTPTFSPIATIRTHHATRHICILHQSASPSPLRSPSQLHTIPCPSIPNPEFSLSNVGAAGT